MIGSNNLNLSKQNLLDGRICYSIDLSDHVYVMTCRP